MQQGKTGIKGIQEYFQDYNGFTLNLVFWHNNPGWTYLNSCLCSGSCSDWNSVNLCLKGVKPVFRLLRKCNFAKEEC